jgi:hypothetical protein
MDLNVMMDESLPGTPETSPPSTLTGCVIAAESGNAADIRAIANRVFQFIGIPQASAHTTLRARCIDSFPNTGHYITRQTAKRKPRATPASLPAGEVPSYECCVAKYLIGLAYRVLLVSFLEELKCLLLFAAF